MEAGFGGEAGQSSSLFSRILAVMARHPHLGCLLLAAVLSLASYYAKSMTKPLVIPQPPPKRFFPSSSLVLDYPYGNIVDLSDVLADEESLFVMYYAPWCAQSKRVREEFQKAAVYLQSEIRFAAVNCWYINGTCRQQNSFQSFPVIFLYINNLDGFRYRGPLSAQYMVQFVQKMLYPMTHIQHKDDLALFVAERDNAVLGFFNFNNSPQPPGFQQFYYAAMRTYELDPSNPVDFCLISDPVLGKGKGFQRSGIVHLVRSMNYTLMYPPNWNITSSNLTLWVFRNKQTLSVAWLFHSGTKSLTFSSHISENPAIILFLPNYPLGLGNDYFSLLREVALEYHTCVPTTNRENLINSLIFGRWTKTLQQMSLSQMCRNEKEWNPPTPSQLECDKHRHLERLLPTKRCCQSVLVDKTPSLLNSCDVCLNYLQTNPVSWHDCDMHSIVDHPAWPTFRDSFSFRQGSCSEQMPSYNPGEFLTVCCQNHSYYNTPARRQYIGHGRKHKRKSNDPYILESVKGREARQCEFNKLQKKYAWEPVVHLVPGVVESSDHRLFGYGCSSNESLTFLTMDSKWSFPFLQRLASPILRKHSEPSLFIVDLSNEAQYMMEVPLTKSNIVDFIHNYTEQSLPGQLRSAKVDQKDLCVGSDTASSVCVIEATSHTFKQIIMEEDKDVIMYFYAPWCGFCAGFAHIYLSLARYFRAAKNVIFARINMYNNDLPWEYTADVYPTITMFPAYRKSESATFPDNLKKTLPNLIYFVLHHGTQSLKLETGLSICSKSCIQTNQETAVQRIQQLQTSINVLENRLQRVHSKLTNYKDSIGKTDDDPMLTFYRDGSNLLDWYEKTLQKTLYLTRLQMGYSRYLNRALLNNKGYFIERHKLTAILNKYNLYQKLHQDVLSQKEEIDLQTLDELNELSIDRSLNVVDIEDSHELSDAAQFSHKEL